MNRFFMICVVSGISPIASLCAAPATQPASQPAVSFSINLADYAKGDGSDETDAIQRAFDAIPPKDASEGSRVGHPGGELFIPRPPVCYAISKTIHVIEKWNTSIRCQSPVWGSRGMPTDEYFRWIGSDNGLMFEFRSCKGMVIDNLSMTGLDERCLADPMKTYNLASIGRLTNGVTGIRIGPEGAVGFQTSMIFNLLRVTDVDVAVRLGKQAANGPDVRELSFQQAVLGPFSSYGVIADSGNLANVTFETLATAGARGAKAAFLLNSGEVLVLNWSGIGWNLDPDSAEVVIHGGGIHIVKAWSEWPGPFLKTSGSAPEWTEGTYGSINFPIIIEGVRHYSGQWMDKKVNQKLPNPVPLSIIYDRPIPLHLLGCSFWGGVQLNAFSQGTILDYGTVFIDKDSVGFIGEGVSRYGRVIHIGTRHPENGRILQPYIVDRRNTPGTAPPKTGVWEPGDAIINIEPDPTKPSKSWRGWVCIKAGEPGKWAPFGALGKTED